MLYRWFRNSTVTKSGAASRAPGSSRQIQQLCVTADVDRATGYTCSFPCFLVSVCWQHYFKKLQLNFNNISAKVADVKANTCPADVAGYPGGGFFSALTQNTILKQYTWT